MFDKLTDDVDAPNVTPVVKVWAFSPFGRKTSSDTARRTNDLTRKAILEIFIGVFMIYSFMIKTISFACIIESDIQKQSYMLKQACFPLIRLT